MIEKLTSPDKARVDFVIKPNQAMSWKSLLLVYLIIAFVTVAVGVVFFLRGLTLILPFSGLEVLLLGAALYVSAWKGGIQEVLSITENSIIFERGRHGPEMRKEFQRAWVKVILERSGISWYPSRLLLRSHGHQLEVGRFLNEQERQGLALELQQALETV